MIERIQKASFGIVFLLLQLVVFINSKVLFGEKFESEYGTAMATYLLFYLAIFSNLHKDPTFNMTLKQSFLRFFIFIILGICIAYYLPIFSIFQIDLQEDPQFMKGILAYQVLFVAYVEETTFRGVLPKILPTMHIFKHISIKPKILASILFGFFHISTYYILSQKTGQNLLVLIVIAILAGLLFQGITDKFGLPASIGFHAGLNIANLEVL